MSLSELTNLKKKINQLQRDADRSAGALDETMKRLKKEFKVGSLEDAETLLEEIQKKETKAKKQFEKSLAEFREEWSELL